MTVTHITQLRTALPILTSLLIGGSLLASGVDAAPAQRPTQGSIKSVVLTTADIVHVYGGTFKAFINGVISNQDLASAEKTAKSSSGPTITNVGRITGYDTVWFRGTRASSLSVTNAVSQYRNSSFPQALFGQFSHPMKQVKGITMKFSPFNGVGDQALMLTERAHGTTAYGIVFRRGSYIVDIVAGAQHGTVSISSVAKLAAIEDQRIQAHG